MIDLTSKRKQTFKLVVLHERRVAYSVNVNALANRRWSTTRDKPNFTGDDAITIRATSATGVG